MIDGSFAPVHPARLRHLGLSVWFVCVAGLCAGTERSATASPQDAGASDSLPVQCPERSAVWAGVAALIGRERLPSPEPPPSLLVQDEGDRYRVGFGARAHDYTDAQRDCARRAHVAAVFVALTLVPPQFLLAEPPTPLPPPPPPPAKSLAGRLELGPWAAAAVRSDEGRAGVLGGAAVRVLVGAGRFAALAGVGASLPASVGPSPVREQRLPFELGARRVWRGQGWEAGADLAGVVTLLRVKEPGSGPAASSVDPGLRVGGILAVGGGRLVPFVSLFADMSFASRAVALIPDGVVGRTSWLRAGGMAGVAWRFR
jgi:hypothetical protein